MEKLPKLKDYHVVGTQVLVELLSSKELAGTNLEVPEDFKTQEPEQGYIKEIGPMVKEEYGLKVGQRVVIIGTCNALPAIKGKRKCITIEPHGIKGVLEEETSD